MKRALAIWGGSFFFVATFLVAYYHMPWGPLCAAGALTFVGTLVIGFRSRRQR